MLKPSNEYLLLLDKINSELKTFAEFLSKELFIYYLQFLKEEHTFDFNKYTHLSPTGDKTVQLILLCHKSSIEFTVNHKFISDFSLKQIRPELPISDIQPINDFIQFYNYHHRRIKNAVYPYSFEKHPILTSLYYDTRYGTIYYDKYSLSIEDDIVKFTWLLPDSIQLLKLLVNYESI